MIRYKVVITGDKNTGKSMLTSRLSGKEFTKEYSTTIGVEFESILLQNVGLKVHIWDLGGDYRFENIYTPYFRGVDIILFVYSIDSKESLLRLYEMYKKYKDNGAIKEQKIIVVCNKLDFINDSNIELSDEGSKWAVSIDAGFISVSAKTNTNVDGLFKMLLYEKISGNQKTENKIWRSCNLL